jgi:branched-chain amino acid transport system substrate-binding protein
MPSKLLAGACKKHAIALFALAIGVVLGSCGNASGGASGGSGTSGVYKDRIVVGGVASLTGVLTADFAPIFDGIHAYFDMINANGGVYGRKLDLAYEYDDQSNPTQDVAQVRNLIDDNVFAVVGVATPSFAGAQLLARAGIPTFGLNVNPQWNNVPVFFGSYGSYVDFTAPQIEVAYLAQQVGATKAAVVAYNVPQSISGCQGAINGLKEAGIEIVDEDLSVPVPAVDLTADVSRMKDAGAQLVVSCLDVAGNLVLSQAIHQVGASLTQYWEDGYDQSVLDNPANTALMQGVYFLLQHAPISVGFTEPDKYPGMAAFVRAMARYEPGKPLAEAALAGWINADLFVTGLKLAGPHPTRQKLVRAINSITNYTAGGILPRYNWRVAHGPTPSAPICIAYVQVQGREFAPVLGSFGSVFTCLPPHAKPGVPIRPVLVPGTPGVSRTAS